MTRRQPGPNGCRWGAKHDTGGLNRQIMVAQTIEIDVGADRKVSEYILLHYLLYKDLVGKQHCTVDPQTSFYVIEFSHFLYRCS